MKRYFNFINSFVFLLLAISGCKKDEQKVILQGGMAPVLEASVPATIPLSFIDQDKEALTLSWTNPNYQFSNGISSLDVTYLMEVDTAGANFSSTAKKTLSFSTDLSRTFTQKEFNVMLISDMSLTIGQTYDLEIRVTSSIGAMSSAPLRSNVVKLNVTPYQDPTLLPPDLFITGDATPAGWTNTPPADQKFTYLGGKKYEIVMAFVPGKAYKFLTVSGQWQPQYGSASSTGGTLQVNDGSPGSSDPPSINTPAAAGNYKITVDMGALTYTIAKI